MDRVIIIGERPADVPEDWTVYNAPRPLYGHKEWEGRGGCGIFFAAVDPQGKQAEWCAKENCLLHAREVEYVTRKAVLAWFSKWAKEKGIAPAARWNDITDAYLQHKRGKA